MESLRSFAPLDDRRGEGGRTGTAPRPGQCPSAPPCRPIFVFEHCGGTVKTRNQCFSADLSGARPRRWKSEFLSTAEKVLRLLRLFFVLNSVWFDCFLRLWIVAVCPGKLLKPGF
jgi:hypothetical protein